MTRMPVTKARRTLSDVVSHVAFGGDRVVLSQFRGGAVPYIAKLAGPRTRVQSVHVDGNAGFFISGAPPVVLLDDRNGHPSQMTPVLDGGSVLVWDRGRVAYRLESHGGLTQALAITRSLR